jgi:hypothetical protein
MSKPFPDHPRILFLLSDTGGGHRSAAEATAEALHLEFGNLFKLVTVTGLNQDLKQLVKQSGRKARRLARSQTAHKVACTLAAMIQNLPRQITSSHLAYQTESGD